MNLQTAMVFRSEFCALSRPEWVASSPKRSSRLNWFSSSSLAVSPVLALLAGGSSTSAIFWTRAATHAVYRAPRQMQKDDQGWRDPFSVYDLSLMGQWLCEGLLVRKLVANVCWGCWGLWGAVGDCGGCWGLLGVCWRLLEVAGGCWGLLAAAGKLKIILIGIIIVWALLRTGHKWHQWRKSNDPKVWGKFTSNFAKIGAKSGVQWNSSVSSATGNFPFPLATTCSQLQQETICSCFQVTPWRSWSFFHGSQCKTGIWSIRYFLKNLRLQQNGNLSACCPQSASGVLLINPKDCKLLYLWHASFAKSGWSERIKCINPTVSATLSKKIKRSPPWQLFWHGFWHTIWKCKLDTYIYIYIIYIYIYIFWHSFWHILWDSFWHVCWHYFWHSTWHLFWHSFNFFWHLFWHSI